MQNTDTLVQQVLDLNVQTLETADQCAEQLRVAAGEANKMAASAVGYAQMAIRIAIKAGQIMTRAKELVGHGNFYSWLEINASMITPRTAANWMRLANQKNVSDLLDNPNIKNISDAYRATGILPEPEPKPEGEGDKDKVKLPWSPLKFSTRIDDWTKEAALDWLYEYDRAAQWARALRVQFGLT
jgi:hypothetical protein